MNQEDQQNNLENVIRALQEYVQTQVKEQLNQKSRHILAIQEHEV